MAESLSLGYVMFSSAFSKFLCSKEPGLRPLSKLNKSLELNFSLKPQAPTLWSEAQVRKERRVQWWAPAQAQCLVEGTL
jgi:hypothetical protein